MLASACGGSNDTTSSGDPQTEALSRCNSVSAVAPGTTLNLATTVAPITSIVANVAGGLANITGIVPEGTNSHTFEPSPSVAAVLSKADVVFVNGLVLEEPTKDLATANIRKGAVVCELGTAVLPEAEYIYDFSFPKDGGKPNPHLWTDPMLASKYAMLVRDVLVKADPANADHYRANATAYLAKLDLLDAGIRTASTTVPKRTLLTYHDAYAYFARDYGWSVLGAIQPSSFDEPTPGEVAKLIEQVKAAGVPAIFGSEVFASPVLEQIGKETGAKYVDVLRDDDLPGEPGDAEHSFLGLMQFDYVTLVTALGGDAGAIASLDLTDVAPDTAEYPQ